MMGRQMDSGEEHLQWDKWFKSFVVFPIEVITEVIRGYKISGGKYRGTRAKNTDSKTKPKKTQTKP